MITDPDMQLRKTRRPWLQLLTWMLLWSEPYLDVVRDEDLTKVKHLQHGGCIVVADTVALQHIFGSSHLPGQPALSKGSIEWQHVGQMTWFTAAASLILLHTLSDRLHLPLLTVGTWTDAKRSAFTRPFYVYYSSVGWKLTYNSFTIYGTETFLL